MATDQWGHGDVAVAMRDVLGDEVAGAAGVPVGRALEFTDCRTAHGALEESSVRAVPSAEVDVALLRVMLGWTGGVLTAEFRGLEGSPRSSGIERSEYLRKTVAGCGPQGRAVGPRVELDTAVRMPGKSDGTAWASSGRRPVA